MNTESHVKFGGTSVQQAAIESSPLVERARMFAIGAHQGVGQKRKYTSEPYVIHLASVAQLVEKSANGTPEMIAAAWLHDVVEDTQVDLTEIRSQFGDTVALYVNSLTNTYAVPGNRAARKAMDKSRLASSCPEVKTIKLADLIDNTSTIVKYDPDFAKVYMKEKRELLSVLQEGSPLLLARAERILADYERNTA